VSRGSCSVICLPRLERTGVFPFALIKGGSALSRDHCSSNAATRSTSVLSTVYSLNPREEGIGDTFLEACRDGLRVAFARFRYSFFACRKATASHERALSATLVSKAI
jgi:hypothetical protein